MELYQQYVLFQAERSRKRIAALVAISFDAQKDNLSSDSEQDNGSDFIPTEKKTRKKRGVMARRTEGGERQLLQPEDTMWYKLYVDNLLMEEEVKFQSKFRSRFRLPYQNYLELVDECKISTHFSRWHVKKEGYIRRTSPIELLVLGALRYLGRGWTFDDIEEATAISTEVHRCFFHAFIEFGSTILYEKHVNTPMTYAEAKRHMGEFEKAGFNGCVGSSDCTHITSEKIDYRIRNNHLGPKSSHTTRTFSLTANHRRRILHSTRGGPGRWNDQTMVRFDQFVSGIRDGKVLEDIEFQLYERDRFGKVITIKYRGGYVIVDNGYLQWSVTVPPFKVSNSESEIRWSKWLESMRKDVECTFGILKGRFRILKTGIRLHGAEVVDQIWLTCCALHNWLIDIDGLDNEWEGAIPVSDWTGTLGDHDFEGIEDQIPNEPPPNPIARITTALEPRTYDVSGLGPGDDVHEGTIMLTQDDAGDGLYKNEDDIRNVRDLPLGFFRSRLVEHFDILFKKGEIYWPKKDREQS